MKFFAATLLAALVAADVEILNNAAKNVDVNIDTIKALNGNNVLHRGLGDGLLDGILGNKQDGGNGGVIGNLVDGLTGNKQGGGNGGVVGNLVDGLTGNKGGNKHDGGLVGDLGLDRLNLGIDILLPAGIQISLDLGPKFPPPAGCTNMWHPPHHDVDMDGCDNHGSGEWHWVHPCEVCKPQPTYTWTTKTITETCLTTVISCPPQVTNCPGRTTQVTVTIPATTTICPVPVTTAPPNTWVPPATTLCPTLSTSIVPATTQPPAATTPVVVVPPTNQTWTQPPPVVVGAANKVQNVGIAAAIGAIAVLLL